MAAQAQREIDLVSDAARVASRPRLARESDPAHKTPVHAHHALLEAEFTEPSVEPFSLPVKLALVIGLPIALWAGIAFGAARALDILRP